MSTPTAEAPDTTASAAPVRRRRIAPLIAIPVAVVMLLLVILLATRDPATERLGKSPLVGKQAPPVEGITLKNEQFTLDHVRGDWVVVNFFGSWCTPCIQEHPELVSFQEGAPQRARRNSRQRRVRGLANGRSPVLREARRRLADTRAGHRTASPVGYGVHQGARDVRHRTVGPRRRELLGGVTAERLDSLHRQVHDSGGDHPMTARRMPSREQSDRVGRGVAPRSSSPLSIATLGHATSRATRNDRSISRSSSACPRL
jgi:hypothetical protein